MFYYTPKLGADTADIPGLVDRIISDTNQGYVNSEVYVRVKAHCIEQAPINEERLYSREKLEDRLHIFKAMKGTVRKLLNTADAAMLLTLAGTCDLSNRKHGMEPPWSEEALNTVSIVRKDCIEGFTPAHELGHHFGALHNIEEEDDLWTKMMHGHLIEKGSSPKGRATIMAKPSNEHPRVNYYSNPEINHPVTRTPTGVRGISDVAGLINLFRFEMAAVGDESSPCGEQHYSNR